MGLVSQVFHERDLAKLGGWLSIGHTRYSTTGSSRAENAQPFVVSSRPRQPGSWPWPTTATWSTSTRCAEVELDCGVTAAHVDRLGADRAPDRQRARRRLARARMRHVLCDAQRRVLPGHADARPGLRRARPVGHSPAGARPARRWLGGRLRELRAGHHRRAAHPRGRARRAAGHRRRRRALRAIRAASTETRAGCSFEFIYFARPDSLIDGQLVYSTRERMGEELAREHPVEADFVMPVPDSATPAAIGFARAAGLPYREGLVKNRYIGRTFIQPHQQQREAGVDLKFNPLPEVLRGQRIALVDDSIVRGTTTPRIVGDAAPRRRGRSPPAHLRAADSIRLPPRASTPRPRTSLIANTHTVEEIRAGGRRRLARLSEPGRTGQGDRRCPNASCATPVSTAATRCRSTALRRKARAGARRDRELRRRRRRHLAAAEENVRRIGQHVRSTHGPQVLGDFGAFAGLFHLTDVHDPVLVASTDGVGTKVLLGDRARRLRRARAATWSTCRSTTCSPRARGRCSSSTTWACTRSTTRVMEALVGGMAAACRENGCALLGGETAQLPDLYAPGHYRPGRHGRRRGRTRRRSSTARASTRATASGACRRLGLHTNGFSLARQIVRGLDLATDPGGRLGRVAGRGAAGSRTRPTTGASSRCWQT